MNIPVFILTLHFLWSVCIRYLKTFYDHAKNKRIKTWSWRNDHRSGVKTIFQKMVERRGMRKRARCASGLELKFENDPRRIRTQGWYHWICLLEYYKIDYSLVQIGSTVHPQRRKQKCKSAVLHKRSALQKADGAWYAGLPQRVQNARSFTTGPPSRRRTAHGSQQRSNGRFSPIFDPYLTLLSSPPPNSRAPQDPNPFFSLFFIFSSLFFPLICCCYVCMIE